MDTLESNITDVALIFEGGGMRASYSSAVVVELLRNNMFFGHVYGVSAGSSNAVNYLSRDVDRSRDSFTKLIAVPNSHGTRQFLQHKGWFNAHYIYQEMGRPEGEFPFDQATFMRNPAQVTIAGLERDRGRTRFWTKDDMRTLDDLMLRVRASSTLPIVMPPAKVDGECCYDGGLGEGNGILLPQAKRDGFERFFVVRTRPRGFRKPLSPNPWLLRWYWRYPELRRALRLWGAGYNAICDELEALEREGRAYVFYAEDMAVRNNTVDLAQLEASYAAGERQIRRDLPRLEAFLKA